MDEKFVGDRIDIEEGDGVSGPKRFKWRGDSYEVAEVENAWQDRGQPSVVHRPSWRTRHHRNYFEVLCVSGERFRIYLDRGTKLNAPRAWILERQLPPSE